MQKLLGRGYRVQGQVGSAGYRIDMVVEGVDRRRLAVECDGDRFHGAEQWRQDMQRQRVLERVGWRFWRCFASSYYRDPDGVLNDLLETLMRMGIEPLGDNDKGRSERKFTEHRAIKPSVAEPFLPEEVAEIDIHALEDDTAKSAAPAPMGICLGDKVVLVFSDDQKRVSARLSESGNDLEKGRLAINSPLGRAILGAEEGDEVELLFEDGRQRRVLIDQVEKSPTPAAAPPVATHPVGGAAAVA
jgi:very-short-patch-repair endonuclease